MGLWKHKDDQIRREIGKQCGKVIIDRITRCGKASQNLMIQLATVQMVQNVISNWNDGLLGGTTVRTTKKGQPESFWGIAKGVPTDIDDAELQSEVKTNINGQEAIRLTKYKDGQKVGLKAVKIKFSSEEDLESAITNGLTIDYLYFQVEKFSQFTGVIQCNKCKRYNHMQSICGRGETCDNCGAEDHTAPGEKCDRPPKCVNCAGPHRAREREHCPKYKELYIKLQQRQNGPQLF